MFRGIEGYGIGGTCTPRGFSLSDGVPVAVVIVDRADSHQSISPSLEDLVAHGLVTGDEVDVVTYAEREAMTGVSPSSRRSALPPAPRCATWPTARSSDGTAGLYPLGTHGDQRRGARSCSASWSGSMNARVSDLAGMTALGIGLLGSFTTFSTFVWETLRMVEDRQLLGGARRTWSAASASGC